MDTNDVKSAATYVNNLLLARGLLRNGKSINFAQLAQSSRRKKQQDRHLRFEVEPAKDGSGDLDGVEKEEDNAQVTTQVLNLIHDLVVRRDRDQSQQEQTAQTILRLQSEASSSITTTRRYETANKNLKRELAAQESLVRAAETAARAAESSARTLREEAAKAKTLLVQVRTQCANDVRKRDLELARLRTHLSGQQRGSAGRIGPTAPGVVAPSCKITRGPLAASSLRASVEDEQRQMLSVQDAEYSLRQETNEFLTQLSQSLSDENDSLILLLRDTIATLKELQGISDAAEAASSASSSHQSLQHSATNTHSNDSLITTLPSTLTDLSLQLSPVLASLRDLLSTPSFVSIEEVQVRDEEIERLRAGWEKMEQRWKEAVGLMQGWRRRMLSGGDTVNLDEVREGLRLGEGVDFELEMDEAGGVEQDESVVVQGGEEDESELVESSIVENLFLGEGSARPGERHATYADPQPALLVPRDSSELINSSQSHVGSDATHPTSELSAPLSTRTTRVTASTPGNNTTPSIGSISLQPLGTPLVAISGNVTTTVPVLLPTMATTSKASREVDNYRRRGSTVSSLQTGVRALHIDELDEAALGQENQSPSDFGGENDTVEKQPEMMRSSSRDSRRDLRRTAEIVGDDELG